MLNVLVVTFSGNKMYLSLKNTSKIYSSKKKWPHFINNFTGNSEEQTTVYEYSFIIFTQYLIPNMCFSKKKKKVFKQRYTVVWK